jgi:predicted permease
MSYWVFFPAFSFYETSRMNISLDSVTGYSMALLCGFFAALLVATVVGSVCRFSPDTLTSVFQGAGRHNTFIGIAVSAQLFGEIGTTFGTLVSVILVPISKIVAVLFMFYKLNRESHILGVIKEIARNPIIVSIFIGIIFNQLNLGDGFIAYQVAGLIGKGTLPILLLVIGSNLVFTGIHSEAVPFLVSTVSKMIVFPTVTFFISRMLGLSNELTIIAVIFGCCPTSPAGFPLAKQMGGNAPLMAIIISLQTAVSVLMIPIAVFVARRMLE